MRKDAAAHWRERIESANSTGALKAIAVSFSRSDIGYFRKVSLRSAYNDRVGDLTRGLPDAEAEARKLLGLVYSSEGVIESALNRLRLEGWPHSKKE